MERKCTHDYFTPERLKKKRIQRALCRHRWPKCCRRGWSAGPLWENRQEYSRKRRPLGSQQRGGESPTFALVSPFTHVKNKETEGAKHDGSDLLPVHRQAVPLGLILQKQRQTRLPRQTRPAKLGERKEALCGTMRCSPQKMIQKESSME